MPEPLIHFIIPLFLLMMLGLNLKKSIIISSLAIVPDLDVIFHVHRSASHSIIFILTLSIVIILILNYCLTLPCKYASRLYLHGSPLLYRRKAPFFSPQTYLLVTYASSLTPPGFLFQAGGRLRHLSVHRRLRVYWQRRVQ